jgi:thioredoxin-like negative regulator of GroEL
MNHLTNINDIEQYISNHRLCLFYIKAPDCGVCNVMLGKVVEMAENHPKLEAFYTDITEEPLVAGRFLVYSGPTVLLLLDGREVCRASGFIDIVELERKINQLEEVCDL